MIAQGLLEAGATVYITSRKPEMAEQAARELSASSCHAIAANLATPEAGIAAANAVKARETRLDILVNNAGRTWGAPLESFPDRAWAEVMSVNVQGPFTLVRELLPLLKAAGRMEDPARVINIGSVAGAVVEPLKAYSYSASKAALHHLSRVLAAELAAFYINVNVVVPGYFPTQMTAHIRGDQLEHQKLVSRVPLQRLGCAEDIAGTCIFLASRAGSYITGSEIFLDGGLCGNR
jgi:NAD(P)-dependent dehydrogenase (short-subunit alcohol dehydrogenase family)